jgi:hypothetical protein
MTGIPDNNFPAFNATAQRLRDAGHDVISPRRIQTPNGANAWADYLRADLREMLTCDTVALLPGWEASAEAHLELHVAHRLGIRVVAVDALIPNQ